MATLVERYDGFLFDLDGVLYRGDRPVEGAAGVVDGVRAAGRRPVFVTNNSARTPDSVASRLSGMGIAATPEEVVTSAMAAATMARARGARSAFVIGEEGIRAALSGAGIEVRDGDPDRADVVVVGWDRSVDYAKLRTASLLVQRGSALVATNADASYPAPDGEWPGAGAILAAIETTTGVRAEVAGKPHPPLFEEALRRAGGGPALAVGDRLETDIAGAVALGIDTLLVLSGVSGPSDLSGAAALPTYVWPTVSGVLEDPAPPRIRAAGPADRASVSGLLEEGGLAGDGVADRIPLTLVAERDGRIVGTVSVEMFGADAHVRSLAVAAGERSHGVGAFLSAAALAAARERGASRAFAVTETAEGFFVRLGFLPIGPRDALPPAIRETPLIREHCATTAVALLHELAGHPSDPGEPGGRFHPLPPGTVPPGSVPRLTDPAGKGYESPGGQLGDLGRRRP
ncbi:MAG: HAD-IIA family hydrolase [Actinobacteria bacterium]|nr:HAD-IIA family hydrolase [Actinomycetota bacterium]